MNPPEYLRDVLAQLSTVPIWVQLLTKVTLLLAAAWVVHFSLARANPRWRTLLWRGVAVSLVLVGVWTYALPGLAIRIPTRASAFIEARHSSQPTAGRRDPRLVEPANLRRAEVPASAAMSATPLEGPAEARPETAPPIESSGPRLSWPAAILGIWCLGVALLVIRLAIALVGLARLLRTSQAAADEIVAEVGRIAAALGCRRGVRVRSSRQYAVPFQCGLLRPVLVLPERMCRPAHRGQLPGVIAHELTHVQSADFGWNAALQVVATLLWFHPLAWRVGSAHRAACDAVCDAVSASYVGDVAAYCRTLAQVALEGAASFPAAGLAMARSCDVRRRIAVLQRRVFAAAPGRRAVAGAVSAGLLVSALLAGMRFALAEEPAAAVVAAAKASPGVDLYGDPLPPGAIARLGTIRYRLDLNEFQQQIAFAADNKTLISQTWDGSAGGSFLCWDATNGKLLRRVGPKNGMVSRQCAITPDGKVAVTVVDAWDQRDEGGEASSSRFVLKWWEVAAGKELASLAIPDYDRPCVAIAADGATAATGELDGSRGAVRIWDRRAGKQTAECMAEIDDVVLSTDGKMAALVDRAKGVLLWDIASKQTPRTVLASSKNLRPRTATFSQDGKLLAVAGDNRDVAVLEASTGRLLRTLDWPHPFPNRIAFSADGKQLALAHGGFEDNNHNVEVWDVASGKLRCTFAGSSGWMVTGMAFSPDGRLLALATNVLKVWDLSTGKCLSADYVGHDPCIREVAFLGESETAAVIGCDDAVRLWDARTGRRKLSLEQMGYLAALAVSPDGKLLASAGTDGEKSSVRISDAATGKQLHEFAVGAKGVLRVGFSTDGKRLAGVGDDGKVRVWSVENGTLLSENDLRSGLSSLWGGPRDDETMVEIILQRAVFSPDARFLVAEFGGTFIVLSAETGKELRTFRTGGLQSPEMAISPDSKLLLSNQPAEYLAPNGDGRLKRLDPKTHELRLWDLSNGKELWRQDLPGGQAGPVAFSADGKRFAVALRGESRAIRVCDLAKREVLQTLENVGHPTCLRFSPDGRLLVAGMEDGSAVTWEVLGAAPAEKKRAADAPNGHRP